MAELASGEVSGTAATSRLLEREHELERVGRAIDRLGEGVGTLILVEGSAGIGKTALLRAAAEIATSKCVRVRSGAGGELECRMAFGVARQLLESVVERASEKERDRLLAGSAGLARMALQTWPSDSPPTGDPFAPLHGLYWLVSNLADSDPLLLIVDDAQWADSETLRWLHYLARRLADLPVAVIAAARSRELDAPPELAPLRLQADETLVPAPLTPHAVGKLITEALQAEPPPEFSAACAGATAGNPFLLSEVMRTLRADDIEPGGAAADAIAKLGPESVARYVLMRLGRYGEEAISLARAIAVLGGSPQIRYAASLAGLDEERAAKLCDQLREAEILSPGSPIEFVHPLVRTAIYQEQSEEARSAAHRRAVEVLGDGDGGPNDIAPHLIACTPNGDQTVVEQLGDAAWEAIRAGAHDSARTFLERALEEPPQDDLPVRIGLGMTLMQTDPTGATDVWAEVAERTHDPRMRLRAIRLGAMSHFFAGTWYDAVRGYEALLDALPKDDREQRLVTESQLCCIKSASVGRDPLNTQRIEAAARGARGGTPGECLVRQALSLDRIFACAPVEEVVDLAVSMPPAEWLTRVMVPGAASRVLAWCGSWDVARTAMTRFTELAQERGLLMTVSYGSGFLAEINRLGGRLADAENEARIALDIANAAGPLTNPSWQAVMVLLATLIDRGELEEAESVASGVDLSRGMGEVHMTPWPLEIGGYLLLARGALGEGVEVVCRFGQQAEEFGLLNPAGTAWRREAAPALAALDRTKEGEELIAVAEERARTFGAPHVLGAVLRSRALLEPRKRQIETLRESVAALETYGPPHELARSFVELGASLRRDGQRVDSREPLRRALELAHSSGAGGTETRAREELAAAGSRPRSAFRTGVASLTASELRTAKLAAQGLTNVEIAQRLFVSRKTVEKHLGNAYTKLEISSRTELPAALDTPGAE